jgi:pyruvate-formate lyase
MKKNLIIAALTLVSVFSVAFGYQQKMVAEKFKQLAEENERLAREQAERALQELRRAELYFSMAKSLEVEANRKLHEKKK